MNLIYILTLILLPALILVVEKKIKWIKLVGAVVVSYFVGITIGNLLPSPALSQAATTLSEASVLFAIPLLLFTTDLKAWLRLARATVHSFLLVIISVMTMSALCFFYFHDSVPEASKISGMLVGVFTGGTPNMVAIGKALTVNENAFIILNAADLIVSGLLLFVLMSVGPKIYGLILKPFSSNLALEIDEAKIEKHYQEEPLKEKVLEMLTCLGLTILIVGTAVLGSKLILGELSVIFIILTLTALSLLASFHPRIQKLQASYHMGQYALLIFCVSVGSMARIHDMLNTSGVYLIYLTITLLGAMLLHLGLCFVFKIDRDTALITSVAGIYGPAFIGPFVSVLKNKEVLVSGVTCGLVGYALGTYLGIGMHYLLIFFTTV